MFVGGQEILYEDTMRVAKKAKKAGVDVTVVVNKQMPMYIQSLQAF